MNISSLGEDGLIAYIASKFKASPPLQGIGDDCAVIYWGEEKEEALLVTTDALVEGVHFLREITSMRNLGYKSVQVNVSDIAAMGGTPLYLLLTLGLPKTTDLVSVEELIEGIHEGCAEASMLLVGGDTVVSPDAFFMSITVLGKGKKGNIKYRHTAKEGDVICVTGTLGDSAAALKLLLEKDPLINEAAFARLKSAFQQPRAHLTAGMWLGREESVHAMMDLSDGLAEDLARLAKASGCGATVDLEKLPLSSSLLKAAEAKGWNPASLAVGGGEDYCLLCAVDPATYLGMAQRYQKQLGASLWGIGRLTGGAGGIQYEANGCPVDVPFASFHHF